MVDFGLVSLVFVALLLIWNGYLTYLLRKTRRQNELFFDDGSKNLRDLVTRSITENRAIHERAAKIESDIVKVSQVLHGCYQRFALVRYNPFSDTGSDQSFSLALLDMDNNGYVITSIHGREINRVYAKHIEGGKSRHNLSAEEVEAIERAINEK